MGTKAILLAKIESDGHHYRGDRDAAILVGVVGLRGRETVGAARRLR